MQRLTCRQNSDARSLFSLFLNSSNGSDAGTISSLLEAVSGYFDALVRNSGTHFLAEAKSLLDATPSAHVSGSWFDETR